MFLIQSKSSNQEISILFNNQITESIQQEIAVAASDTSVKDNQMGECWIIANLNSKMLLSNILYHQRWDENISGVAEVITLLELLIVIEKKGRHIRHGKIEIGFDNKKGYDKIVKQIYKLNTYT